MTLPITATIAAPLAIIGFALSLNVSMRRVNVGKAKGDISAAVFEDLGNIGLKKATRAFGNFMEYTPLALIMLAIIELQSAPAGLIWGLGIAFLIGRISHAAGMLINPFNPILRIFGMFAVYAIFIVPALWILL